MIIISVFLCTFNFVLYFSHRWSSRRLYVFGRVAYTYIYSSRPSSSTCNKNRRNKHKKKRLFHSKNFISNACCSSSSSSSFFLLSHFLALMNWGSQNKNNNNNNDAAPQCVHCGNITQLVPRSLQVMESFVIFRSCCWDYHHKLVGVSCRILQLILLHKKKKEKKRKNVWKKERKEQKRSFIFHSNWGLQLLTCHFLTQQVSQEYQISRYE